MAASHDADAEPTSAAASAGRGAKPAAQADEKKLPLGPPATYTVSLPADLRADWELGDRSVIYVSLAATSTKPGPRTPKRDPKQEEEEKAAAAKKPAPRPRAPAEPRRDDKPDETPIDLTIELVDAAGRTSRQPLSRYGIARKPLDTRLYRRAGRDAQRFTTIYEIVPQTFVMPVADFVAGSPGFDAESIAAIRLVFDRTEAGTVILEHVGVSTPADPAFLAAPVPFPASAGAGAGVPAVRRPRF
jgi:hypothetical protein